jgi:heme-degrading monooxygenase HmoA
MPAPPSVSSPAGPLVTLTVNRYAPPDLRAGMRRMATDHAHLRGLPGLTFYRLLGTGRGAQLSLSVDLCRWARFAVWQSRAAFELFEDSPWRRQEREGAAHSTTLLLSPLRWHGRWAGAEPLGRAAAHAPSGECPIAVLTRAVIRPSRLAAFWRAVPGTQVSLPAQPGLISALGLGEWPVLQQATFSVWQDEASLRAYAYQGHAHRSAIARTRKENWYSEELFARFEVSEVRGEWEGLPSGGCGLSTLGP